jgi:chemotaxis protein CheX
MYRQELSEIAKVIWDSVLQLPLESAGQRPEASPKELATVAVDVSGSWNGTVTASVTMALGRRIAAAMLQTEPESLSTADVSDALLEIVNMLGGNFKALLPSGCKLSIPRLVDQARDSDGSRLESEATLICDEQPLHLEVHSREHAN